LEEMHARIAQKKAMADHEYMDKRPSSMYMAEYMAWVAERERKRAEVRADPDAPRAVSLPNFPYRHDTEALCNEYLSHVLEAEKERIRLEAALECSLECEVSRAVSWRNPFRPPCPSSRDRPSHFGSLAPALLPH